MRPRLLVLLAMRCAAIVFILAMPFASVADPGVITGGGLPQLVSGKTSVQMTAEKVTLTVFADRVDVDGTYEFHNLGPACAVRMGFPEAASFPLGGKNLPQSIFAHYRSYVDGVKTSTTALPGSQGIERWDVQTVRFAAGGHRAVHVLYSTILGAMGSTPPAAMTEYVLHTGGSWNGPIGSVIVDVKFTKAAELEQPFDIWHGKDVNEATWQTQTAKANGLIAVGPGTPVERGDTIRFEAKNLKPTTEDDIGIIFRYPPKQRAKLSKAGTRLVPPR